MPSSILKKNHWREKRIQSPNTNPVISEHLFSDLFTHAIAIEWPGHSGSSSVLLRSVESQLSSRSLGTRSCLIKLKQQMWKNKTKWNKKMHWFVQLYSSCEQKLWTEPTSTGGNRSFFYYYLIFRQWSLKLIHWFKLLFKTNLVWNR